MSNKERALEILFKWYPGGTKQCEEQCFNEFKHDIELALDGAELRGFRSPQLMSLVPIPRAEIEKVRELIKPGIIIEDTCEECGNFIACRYEIKECKEALTIVEKWLK